MLFPDNRHGRLALIWLWASLVVCPLLLGLSATFSNFLGWLLFPSAGGMVMCGVQAWVEWERARAVEARAKELEEPTDEIPQQAENPITIDVKDRFRFLSFIQACFQVESLGQGTMEKQGFKPSEYSEYMGRLYDAKVCQRPPRGGTPKLLVDSLEEAADMVQMWAATLPLESRELDYWECLRNPTSTPYSLSMNGQQTRVTSS